MTESGSEDSEMERDICSGKMEHSILENGN
jgi:hypothetical protein